MPHLTHEFVIARPIEDVFDAATTAKYWTDWHPATLRVEGAIHHPAQFGDTIIEYVRIADREGSGTWTVTDYDRPHRLVLETDSPIGHLTIGYTVDSVIEGTRFRRDLDYPALGPTIDAAMEQQSSASVTNLKALLKVLLAG